MCECEMHCCFFYSLKNQFAQGAPWGGEEVACVRQFQENPQTPFCSPWEDQLKMSNLEVAGAGAKHACLDESS